MTSPDDLQVVTFALEAEVYGVPISQVKEIISWVSPVRVPHAPSWIEGVVDLRGSIVPVVDLRTRFGLMPATAHTPSRCIIVVSVQDQILGLLVDSVREVTRLGLEALNAIPPAASTPGSVFVRGIARLPAQQPSLLLVLELDRLLSEHEVGELADVC